MENATNTSASPVFRERHPLPIRLWHWTFFLVVISSIITVLFAEYMFDTRANAPMVMEEAAQRDILLSEKQARGIAHGFSEKLWVLHTWLGYGICSLLVLRFVAEVAIAKEDRLRSRIKRALGLVPASDVEKKDRRSYLIVLRGYLVFYLLIFLMACTGLGLVFEDYGIFETYHRAIKQVHELGQWGIFTFAILHISGVLWSDTTRFNGLVSRMIHGKSGV